MTNLRIRSGSLEYVTGDLITITDVAALAEAAELIGIPPQSTINDIRVDQHWDGTTHGTRVRIWWTAPKGEQC